MKTNPISGIEALQLTCTRLASVHACAAQVMDAFQLQKVVQLYLPACSKEQYDAITKHLEDDIICVLPLNRGSRMMIYCDFLSDFNLEQNLIVYQTELEDVFANQQGKLTQPYSVRIFQWGDFEEGLL